MSQYIEALRSYFTKQEGGEEIADDIEERVAEIFDDLKAQGTEAIAIEHVQGVIHQIGQVEEIAGEDENSQSSSGDATQGEGDPADGSQKTPKGKEFFRDSRNKLLGGVLAGCAQCYGGSVNTWRWGYVILCTVWILFVGGFPAAFFDFSGFSLLGVVFLPFAMLSFIFSLLPVFAYVLAVALTPETKTAEDVLRMKGKEVNPQNLVAEVQEATVLKEKQKKEGGDTTFWDIFVGIITVGLSTLLTIGLIVALCFVVAWMAAPDMMAEMWWAVDEKECVDKLIFPVIMCGIMLLASIAIPLYCTIHAAVSSFGKTKSMSAKQRVIWFLLWVASLAAFIGCTVYAVNQYHKAYHIVRERYWDDMQREQEWEADTLELESEDSVAAALLPTDSLASDTVVLSKMETVNRKD